MSETLIEYLNSNGWSSDNNSEFVKEIGDLRFEVWIDKTHNEITIRCRNDNIWQPILLRNTDKLRECSKIDTVKNIIRLNKNISDSFSRDSILNNIEQFLEFIPSGGIDPSIIKSHFENSFDVIEMFQTCLERGHIALDSNGYIIIKVT